MPEPSSLVEECEVRLIDAEKVSQGRALLLADAAFAAIAESFRALADPSRAKIVYALLQQELCVCDIAAVAGVSESATSQHLRVLRNLRLVKSRRNGKMIYYSLDDDHVRVLMGVCLRHLGHEPAGRADPVPRPSSTVREAARVSSRPRKPRSG
ncbi:MAG: metalloregulator ArsR/SmtB family transcription factor [Dehalococcoidia bacterium]